MRSQNLEAFSTAGKELARGNADWLNIEHPTSNVEITFSL
jgi:hypothetical protein